MTDALPDPGSVSVIIPHYAAERRLQLVLAGLRNQTLGNGFEVIVADDGSPTAPVVEDQPFRTRVVRQEDRGFRAAAARNLGARSAGGEILCFLDGDTVPAPSYLADLIEPCQDGLTLSVGRRRHADFSGWDPERVERWLQEAGVKGPPRLPEPQWLADGYTATANLTCADDSSFRFVISAVLAMPATLFHHVGGFDESFDSYGGEDWDLAQRCWLAGADLRHVPSAVAWHDGPDAGGRANQADAKNVETLRLAAVLTHPLIRGAHALHDIPDIAISADVSGWSLGQTVLVAQSWLAGSDAGICLTGDSAAEAVSLLRDPRVHQGEIPGRVLTRARTRVRIHRPVALQGWRLRRVLDHLGETAARTPDVPGSQPACPDTSQDSSGRPDAAVTWISTRRLGSAALRGEAEPPWDAVPHDTFIPVPADAVIERWRGPGGAAGTSEESS